MTALEKLLKGIETVMRWMAYLLLSFMVINTVGGVFCRYVLHSALAWTEELGRYMMIWLGFIGCAFAMRDNAHVGVEMFTDLFRPGAKRAFQAVSRLVVTVFLVVILLKTGEQLNALKIQKTSALMIPMAIPYSAVTFGIAMMLVYNIIHFARLFARRGAAATEK